jgi:subtilisin family serine protease
MRLVRCVAFGAMIAGSATGLGSGIALAEDPYEQKTVTLRGGQVILDPTQRRAGDTAPPPVTERSAPFSVQADAQKGVERLIVTLERRVTESERTALAARGITIGDYLRDTTYAATIRVDAVGKALELSSDINKILKVVPLDDRNARARIDRALSGSRGGPLRSGGSTAAVSDQIVNVRLWQDADLDEVQRAVAAHGEIVRVNRYTRQIQVKVTQADGVERIAKVAGVKLVEPLERPKVQNSKVRESIGAEVAAAAPFQLSGEGVSVGIWDDGHVASRHPSFTGRVFVDLALEQGVQRRDTAHATHVAGTIAGSGDYEAAPVVSSNQGPRRERDSDAYGRHSRPRRQVPMAAPGVAAGQSPSAAAAAAEREFEVRYPGVAPRARLWSFNFTNPTDEITGILAERPGQIDVANNSWTADLGLNCGLLGAYLSWSWDYDALISGSVGQFTIRRIPMVFAAGNERNSGLDGICGLSTADGFPNYRTVLAPGTAKNAITVGAIDAVTDAMTSFSNWGPTLSGRLKPDIVTAGCRDLGNGEAGVISAVPSTGIGRMCGTSMAAPAVTGAIALMIERMTVLGVDRMKTLPSTYKALLIHGAKDLGRPGPDFEFGYGKVQLPATLRLIDDRAFLEERLAIEGQSFTRTISVGTGRSRLKATLAWDDPPTSELADDALANDLDLVLFSPSGVEQRPFVLDPSRGRERDLARPGVDRLNVVEHVLVDTPQPGDWRLEVRATRLGTPIPGGQSFSLVISTE